MNTDTIANTDGQPVPPEASFNEKISHTADGVAQRRTFTDIPFSREIYDISRELAGGFDAKTQELAMTAPEMTPFFEARYLLTDEELEKSGISQVLELASGLSPRGFIACDDPLMKYVEVDLDDKMHFKRKVIEELCRHKGMEEYSNLHLLAGDVSNSSEFLKATELFDDNTELFDDNKEVFVICEGLLRYINWPDKERLASNIRDVLHKHGGMWVTPDIELLSDANSSEKSRQHYDRMAEKLGVDVRPNLFRDENHAYSFFMDLGFKIRMRSHINMADKLVSPKRLNLSRADVSEVLNKRVSFILTV